MCVTFDCEHSLLRFGVLFCTRNPVLHAKPETQSNCVTLFPMLFFATNESSLSNSVEFSRH